MYRIFDDRVDAGKALVPEVEKCQLDNPLIVALPRGGVPVGYEIAIAMHAPLDTIVVRKLGAPLQPELAIGAIASGGIRVLNEALVASAYGMSEEWLKEVTSREMQELERREKAYRGDRPHPDMEGRDIVLVDDGIATGATMRAAAEAIRSLKPSKLIVAVPTGSRSAVRKVAKLVDDVICLESPVSFYAVGQFYRLFDQTSDEEVRELLDKAHDAMEEEENSA